MLKWEPSEERKACKGIRDAKAEPRKQEPADEAPEKTKPTMQSDSDTKLKKHQSPPERRRLM